MTASQAMLVLLGSQSYLDSRNCRREIETAIQHRLPLVRVHDSDTTKNGTPLASLRRTATQRLSQRNSEYVFDEGQIVPWHRVSEFQVLALALIAEQTLLASPAYHDDDAVPLYVNGALAWAHPAFAADAEVHLYVSVDNPDARAPACQMNDLFAAVRLVDALDGPQRRWLLFVSPTCFSEERGERLEAEVLSALAAGVRPVVLYAPETAPFADVIAATPTTLLRSGLFGPLAVEWREAPLHSVSTRLVAKALGARTTQSWRESAASCLVACRGCVSLLSGRLRPGWPVARAGTAIAEGSSLGRGRTSISSYCASERPSAAASCRQGEGTHVQMMSGSQAGSA